MAHDSGSGKRICPCGCDEERTPAAIRRHLKNPTIKSVLVAQQHNYRQQRLNRLRIEAQGLLAKSSGDGDTSNIDHLPPSSNLSDDVQMGGSEFSDEPPPDGDPMDEDGPQTPSDSESDGDLFDGRPDEIFLEDSDEEEFELGQDFQAAPWLQGLTARERLEEVFNVDAATRGHKLTPDEMNAIRAHNFKVDTELGARAYDKLSRAFPALADLPSRRRLQSQITFLSGVKPVPYDCCVNSCCCYTDSYEPLDSCPYCSEDRRDSAGRARSTFQYLPLIPRLVNLFQNVEMAAKLDYRSEYRTTEGSVCDIFDGSHYRRLCRTHVSVEGGTLPHKFFSQSTDLAIGASTDGFGPFKRRKKTCWPIIVILYNLPPEIRTWLIYLLCVGVIPGPKAPKDMDSFWYPLVQELLKLMRGVPAFDRRNMRQFSLRAYLIDLFGDMPAIAKLMRMKGHTGILPCRACRILGIRDETNSRSTAHYTPLHRENNDSYDPLKLPLRTHKEFMRHAIAVEDSPTDAEQERRSKAYGINGVPLLATLSSLSFPDSFPHDFMHIVENIIPMLLELWTGSFKGLDDGSEEYLLSPTVADALGEACAKSGSTIPSAFGARVPNIMTERHHCTAESWFLFTTFLAPVLLHNRFKKRCYYDHFVQLVGLINKCLQFELTSGEIDEIEVGFAQWVQKYEQFYYQYEESRLGTCTMPIHALLHVAQDIRHMGPMWCFWAFVMERFCGSLLPAVKSRKYPFTSLAHRIRDVAQLTQIKLLYQLTDELDLSADKAETDSGQVIPGYDDTRVVYPSREITVDTPLRNKIAAYLVTNFEITRPQALKYIPNKISAWGKLKQLHGGDLIHAWDLIQRYHTSPDTVRDATFIKFILQVDKNSRRVNLPVELRDETFFGQVRKFLVLPLPASFPLPRDSAEDMDVESSPRTLLLAAVSQVKLTRQNTIGMPYFDAPSADLGGVSEVIDARTIHCLAGRIKVHGQGRWACLVRPDVTAKFRLVENSVLHGEED